MKQPGLRPVGLVLGTSVDHVGIQVGRWSENMELDKLSEAMYHARELAMTWMEAEAYRLGADGIVGVRLEIEFKDTATTWPSSSRSARPSSRTRLCRLASGGHAKPPLHPAHSGQDFWTLIQAGYAPLGLVMGTCVYHIAHQGVMSSLGRVGQNVEIPQFTEALYDARELAMSRMQVEAEHLAAEGIVGVQLRSLAHRWGGHTTEFFAIGTAVRPLREDHVIQTPQLVLPLTDSR